jgi:hypothetical protein
MNLAVIWAVTKIMSYKINHGYLIIYVEQL